MDVLLTAECICLCHVLASSPNKSSEHDCAVCILLPTRHDHWNKIHTTVFNYKLYFSAYRYKVQSTCQFEPYFLAVQIYFKLKYVTSHMTVWKNPESYM